MARNYGYNSGQKEINKGKRTTVSKDCNSYNHIPHKGIPFFWNSNYRNGLFTKRTVCQMKDIQSLFTTKRLVPNSQMCPIICAPTRKTQRPAKCGREHCEAHPGALPGKIGAQRPRPRTRRPPEAIYWPLRISGCRSKG